MKLARVRLYIDPEVMNRTEELAERNGVSVTMQIANTLREAAEKVQKEQDDGQRK